MHSFLLDPISSSHRPIDIYQEILRLLEEYERANLESQVGLNQMTFLHSSKITYKLKF